MTERDRSVPTSTLRERMKPRSREVIVALLLTLAAVALVIAAV
jgi:hypothetical protein